MSCSKLLALLSASSVAALARAQISSPVVAAVEVRSAAFDGLVADRMGDSIAIDGDTFVAGAPSHDVPGQFGAGGAWVFARSGTTWTQQAKLEAADGLFDDRLGFSVAIDGDTIALGAPMDDHPGIGNGGSVYVFVRSGTVWSQQAKLVGSGVSAADVFGTSVALRGDTLAVGASADEVGTPSSTGAVYVFVRTGTTWSQQAVLAPADRASGDRFGQSVGLDGDTLAAGAQYGDGALAGSGSAYVFVRSGTVWSEQAELLASDPQACLFGMSIAVSGDRVLVGAPLHDGTATETGAAYVFARTGSAWTEEALLDEAGLATASDLGTSVALEGDLALVGALDDPNPGPSGSAYLYRRSGTSWSRETEVVPEDPRGQFGTSVGISGDTLVAGSPGESASVATQGVAYAFRLTNSPVVYCTSKTNSQGCLPAIGWSGVPSATSASPFLATCTNVINNKNGILFYGFAPENNPFQGGTLCIAPPTVRTAVQNSGGNAPPEDCSGNFAFDFNAHVQSGADPNLSLGVDVYAQYWSRDPALPSTFVTSLSNALHFAIQP